MSGFRHLESLDAYIEEVLSEPRFRESIVASKTEEERLPEWAQLPDWLPERLLELLHRGGIDKLYTHQAEALEAIHKAENLVLSTGVASGKSLCYQIPVLTELLNMPSSRCIMLFPTKALAQDQAGKLSAMMDALNPSLPKSSKLHCGIYDGDTPTDRRQKIRKEAQVLFTNPDMLHMGILPNHSLWAPFFANLHYVVIDEVHIYRGVFGSHFANLIRRLKRIAAFYGRKLQFVCTSATLANARELAEKLLEEPVTMIERDASPHGRRVFLILNPPMVNHELGIRRSALIETTAISRRFLDSPGQAILFTGPRRSVEILYLYLLNRGLENKIRAYRSGYLAENRRQIEKELREGEVQLVVSTNALELGIDIGGLDAVFLNGYPGTISATKQQSGRAGRQGQTALTIMVAAANPLDQYICQHPEFIFDQSPEQALIDPDNPEILQKHLLCAIADMALLVDEPFGAVSAVLLEPHLQILQEDGRIRKVGGRYQKKLESYPAQDVSIRNASSQMQLVSGGELIGYVDKASAYWMVHPNAIYLDQGDTWKVNKLDLVEDRVELEPIVVNYYTMPQRKTEIELLQLFMSSRLPGGAKYMGRVKVTTTITGFKKLRFQTQEILGYEELDLPPSELDTIAWWISLNQNTIGKLRDQGLWRNDPNNYGRGWDKLCGQIRQRDGQRCQNCGLQEDGKAFEVHHKIPFRKFARVEEANAPENLVTLCPRCHRLAEANVLIQSGLSGLGYLLVNISPFFVSCDRKDLDLFWESKCDLASGDAVVAIFDTIPGGVGLSRRLYQDCDKVLIDALALVTACPCTDGCPGCTGPAAENGEGAKALASAMLRELCGGAGGSAE